MANKLKLPLVTKSQLVRDLKALGLAAGQTVMLHASVSAIGWIVGGPEVVLRAILDALGEQGTLIMYVSWEDSTEDWPDWPAERRALYLAECPPFDPQTSRAYRQWSILTEYLRTLPGARVAQRQPGGVYGGGGCPCPVDHGRSLPAIRLRDRLSAGKVV